MSKLFVIGKLALISLLAIIMSIIVGGYLSSTFNQVISAFPSSGLVIHLENVSQNHSAEVFNALNEAVFEADGFLVRRDPIIADNQNKSGFAFGVTGNPQSDAHALNLDFMGSQVFSAEKFEELLKNSNENATLGLKMSARDQILPLPSFITGGEIVYVERLDKLVDDSGTSNGFYTVLGLNESQAQSLISHLSELSGLSEDVILHGTLHSAPSVFFLMEVMPLLFVAAWLLLFALYLIDNFNRLKALGIAVLCGWSRMDFIAQDALNSILIGFIALPLVLVGGLLITNFSFITLTFISFMALCALVVLLANVSAYVLASLIIFKIKPVAAICNRIPRKRLLALLLVFYLGAALSIVYLGAVMDTPVSQIHGNNRIAAQWRKVDGLYIMGSQSVGQDQSSVLMRSAKLSHDYYNWYSSIADKQGVYLVNTQYYSQEILQRLIGKYGDDTPTEPFQAYTISPNYLQSQGFKLTDEQISLANDGVKVYLVPDTLSPEEMRRIEAFYTRQAMEDAQVQSDIETMFNKNPRVAFNTYTPSVELFNWETDTDLPQTCNNPVIYVCTPQNMAYGESESLWAIGLDNAYLRLTESAARQYTSKAYFSKFDLDDNEPVFLPVSDCIAGLTKTLQQTVMLFSTIIFSVMALVVMLALGVMRAYQYACKDDVVVKRLMGYSILAAYKMPYGAVFLVSLLSTIVGVLIRSKISFVLIGLLFISQLILLTVFARSTESQQMNLALKG